MSRARLITLLLAFITLVVFLPASQFDFLNYDDNEYVTENPMVAQGLTAAGVVWAFDGFHAGNWHPVTWLSHMADCSLFGLNPAAQHFVSVLFHAANAALLFVLLVRLTKRVWPAALVAALFAWHPLRVESVAWIAERKDVLSTFFALLALLAYARYAEGATEQKSAAPSRLTPHAARFYWLSILFFALGLMAKPMLVTLPFLLLLLDYWPLARFSPDRPRGVLLREKIPFFMICAIFCVITFFAQKSGQAIVSLAKVPFDHRLENAPVAAAGYLATTFWPVDLCVMYPTADKIAPLLVALSLAALGLISIAAWRWRASQPWFITGWLWFLGTLVPVIGLVQVGGQSMADRYTYIPSIGLFIALVFLAEYFVERMKIAKLMRFSVAGIALLGCIAVTENQLRFWRNSETLFRRAIAVTERNTIALINLGVALESQGRLEEALDSYRQAEKTGNQRQEIYKNLGHVLSRLDRHAESLAVYRDALGWRPNDAMLHSSAGSELAALNRFEEALKEFSAAEALEANYATPYAEAAVVWYKMGHDAEGLAELQAALRLEPDNFKTLATAARFLAANDKAGGRDGRTALELALKADSLSGGGQPLVLDILGMAYAETGDFSNAVASVQSAVEIGEAAQFKTVSDMRRRFELYKNHQPWRESFLATNAPAQ